MIFDANFNNLLNYFQYNFNSFNKSRLSYSNWRENVSFTISFTNFSEKYFLLSKYCLWTNCFRKYVRITLSKYLLYIMHLFIKLISASLFTVRSRLKFYVRYLWNFANEYIMYVFLIKKSNTFAQNYYYTSSIQGFHTVGN